MDAKEYRDPGSMNQAPPRIIFVCEHGSAKSIVAAAYFNKLAGERKFDLRAIARGIHPDGQLAPQAVEGLHKDGLVPGEQMPRRLSEVEAAGASYLVAFCQLPEEYDPVAPSERWNDIPPLSEDYGRSRDAMLDRIRQLLDKLRAA